MTENEITYAIRGCIFDVYNTLGPGLLESAYETALEYEMNEIGLKNSRQIPLPMFYKSNQDGYWLSNGFPGGR